MTERITERSFDEFIAAQRAMYAGGDVRAVADRLSADVVWHVPGTSAIAGDHVGRDAVIEYFKRRRALAGGRMKIIDHERLVRGDTLVQLADGEVDLDGKTVSWRTTGVYRLAADRVAEAWLVPLELAVFDRIWCSLSLRD